MCAFRQKALRALGKGAYWSIGTNPDLYARQGGLACPIEAVTVLAKVDTRLADFGDVIRDALKEALTAAVYARLLDDGAALNDDQAVALALS